MDNFLLISLGAKLQVNTLLLKKKHAWNREMNSSSFFCQLINHVETRTAIAKPLHEFELNGPLFLLNVFLTLIKDR